MLKNKNNKGFTLLELLVAMAIAGIILLSFFKVVDSITKLNIKNDRDIKALNLAQSEIENLRNEIKTKGKSESLEIYNVKKLNNEDIANLSDGRIMIPLNDEWNSKSYNYTKTIDNKDFIIDLYIERSKVFDENSSDTGLYLYTISSITVQPNDKYFSKKSTTINNVKILSRNN